MLDNDGPFMGLAKWVALITALAISLGAPAGYLYFGYHNYSTSISAEVDVKANQISQLISGNPEYWPFEGLRIESFLAHLDSSPINDLHRVVDNSGTIIVQSPSEAPLFNWPTIMRQRALLDYGRPVARLEITQSLQPLYQQTMVIGLFSVLAGLLIYWVLRVVPLRALKRTWDRVTYLASHDALTGLPNRVLFHDRLEHALARVDGDRTAVTVYSLDLDHFKDVNDSLGHAAGDLLLNSVAGRLKACIRRGDTLARMGGDEFSIIQAGDKDPSAAAALADRIISEVGKPFDLNGQEAVIGASIGMAMYTADKPLPSGQLLKNADLALYKSKINGRGKYHFFQDEMDNELRTRRALEADLRLALCKEQFELHYQPQVDLQSQSIVGLEALLRWNHPVRGSVPPAQIIPVLETIGLARELTEWVLHTACSDAATWETVRIAVNVSPSLLERDGLVDMVKRALKKSGLPPGRLEIEITEDVLIADTKQTLKVLNQLKDLGVHIAMDDFGTGYSSLNYLRQFPFDKIKIDRSFISNINQNNDAQAIVRAIVGLSRALGININAEGVETIEEAEVLVAEGCNEVQGYLYGRPMAMRDIGELLARTGTVAPPAKGDPALASVA